MKTKLKPATRAEFALRPEHAELLTRKKLVTIDRNTWVLTDKIDIPDAIIKDNFQRKLGESKHRFIYTSVNGGNTASNRRNAGRKPVQDNPETPEAGFEFNDD